MSPNKFCRFSTQIVQCPPGSRGFTLLELLVVIVDHWPVGVLRRP